MPTAETTAPPIPASEARALLNDWTSSGVEVGVCYSMSHSEGIVLLKGTLQVRDDLLQVHGPSTVLHASIAGAEFGHGPVTVFGRGSTPTESPLGLHIMTRHGDWLFLAPRFDPALAPPRLPE